MKILSLSLLILTSIISCNTTNKATEIKNNTEEQMDKKEMISNGYLSGNISVSSEEGDCPITIKVEGKEGAYYLDPINISEEFKTDDEKDAVGRRYRRQDALGTPFCITVDHQTKEDQTVTIRDRDTMKQERILISEISRKIKASISYKDWLS